MINLYAYSYPSAINKYPGYILMKIGDSTRDVMIRIKEQGGASEYEEKIHIGAWNNLRKIKRDFDVHRVLEKNGFRHKEGAGTEWFRIPGNTVKEAQDYLDQLVTEFEGKKVRQKVVLRQAQQKALDEALEIIATGKVNATVIANLCPRFGKTIWGLMLFNEISKRYGNRVMLLPAYWLSVHTSFEDELAKFDDFLDLVSINPQNEDASITAQVALDNNQRIVIPISLHGELEEWKKKYQWIADIDNQEMFFFADEGDFGTWADNQIKKMEFLCNAH